MGTGGSSISCKALAGADQAARFRCRWAGDRHRHDDPPALRSDDRFRPRSVFKTPFVDLALVPEAASSLIAPRIMGHQRAFALLAAGEPFDAQRGAGSRADLEDRRRRMPSRTETLSLAAANLAKKPPEALRIARDLIRGDRSRCARAHRRRGQAFCRAAEKRRSPCRFRGLHAPLGRCPGIRISVRTSLSRGGL